MKRKTILFIILFALTLLFPLICIVSEWAGYTFVVRDSIPFAAGTTALYAAVSIILMCVKDRTIGKVMSVFVSFLPLLNYVNLVFYNFKTGSTAGGAAAQLIAAAWLIFSVILVVMYVGSVGLKVVFLILAGVLVIPASLMILFGSIALDTVTEKSVSPRGTYCAEIVNSDQGALGGATYVQVYEENSSFNVGSLEFRRGERTVYVGGWDESRWMELSWKDDGILIIDGTEYTIK